MGKNILLLDKARGWMYLFTTLQANAVRLRICGMVAFMREAFGLQVRRARFFVRILEDGMYAIVETGGKQFRVEEGCKIFVAKLGAEVGSEIVLDKVLLLGGENFKAGQPYVENAQVKANVLEHGRGEKIHVFKKWRRNDSRSLKGHRQDYTALKITSITA